MAEEKQATETNAQAIATAEQAKVAVEEDLEGRVVALEAEKAKLIEEKSNYQVAYLKEARKNKANSEAIEEDDDDRMRRIAREAMNESRLAEIAREQDTIIKKALKENKELKLAQLNKTTVSSSIGSHSESQPVRDTSITEEQLSAFKARGWTDKDIERYKRNLQKNAVR